MKNKETALTIIKFLTDNPASSRDLIIHHLAGKSVSLSQSSFSRIMVALIKEGKLYKEGDRKSARYSTDLHSAYFSVEPSLRPVAPYNINFIESINPEQGCLTKAELIKLHQMGTPNAVDLSTLTLSSYYQFILDLSYSSSKMEGNLYTYIDTEVLLKYNEYAEGKSVVDGLMIVNHKHALEYLLSNINVIGVDLQTIRDLHSFLSDGMPGVTPEEQGACRKRIIMMNGSSFKPLNDPHKIPEELNKIIDVCSRFSDPFEQSIHLLGLIPYLQPFVDVNKRTGRLMCNVPLIKAGLAPFSFKDMDKKLYTKGMLALYELNDISLLKKAFMDAYLISAPEMVERLNNAPAGEVNVLKLRYKKQIKYLVSSIIKTQSFSLDQALKTDPDIDASDVKGLADLVNDTVNKMHEGLTAVYGMSHQELNDYKATPSDKESNSVEKAMAVPLSDLEVLTVHATKDVDAISKSDDEDSDRAKQ